MYITNMAHSLCKTYIFFIKTLFFFARLGVSVHPCLMAQSASKLSTHFWGMAMPGFLL